MEQLLAEAKMLLEGATFPWAVCGGYALDLFLNRATRPHGDVDLCAFESDRDAILRYMLRKGWLVYEFRGQGKVRPLDAESSSDAGRNLMCVKEGCRLVEFYPCEEQGMLYHQFFHTGISNLDYVEFLFNKAAEGQFVFDGEKQIQHELPQAILFRDGLPYLAPEIVLLFKALQPEREENQADMAQAWPAMSRRQKDWFVNSLKQRFPEGHPWLDGLSE